MEENKLLKDTEFYQINQLYDECLNYLKSFKVNNGNIEKTFNNEKYFIPEKDLVKEEIRPEDIGFEKDFIPVQDLREEEIDPHHETIQTKHDRMEVRTEDIGFKSETLQTKDDQYNNTEVRTEDIGFNFEDETKEKENYHYDHVSNRLRRLSQQLPKIIITQSDSNLNMKKHEDVMNMNRSYHEDLKKKKAQSMTSIRHQPLLSRVRTGYGDFPKRLVSKSGMENVALISNVPFEKIRLLNDTFHTLINLRWRWIVMGTVVVHFAIWLVFAVFWYIAALAHYDFSPNPPAKSCVTGGKDFLTIFLASVEAQTTIGFGDRAIDEECPESIFLFIMQLILGTGLSGVLTCVVYAKLTRPEKLSRDGVGFSKKAVISMRDGQLCLMIRAWDLNYDHIISSEFSAHFVNTHRTKEGEVIRYYARSLTLQQRQFLLWPVTLVHIIDHASPLYRHTPQLLASSNYEITVSLKGASASMGTFTQSQTSYTPREIVWGHRFPPVVQYDRRKQKYVIDHKKLDATEPIETPRCSASELHSSIRSEPQTPRPETPSSFSEKISAFVLERTSSFRTKKS